MVSGPARVSVSWLSAAGQYKIHTVKDYLDLAEFANGCRLAVVLATLEG
jgi:hypothetical protein